MKKRIRNLSLRARRAWQSSFYSLDCHVRTKRGLAMTAGIFCLLLLSQVASAVGRDPTQPPLQLMPAKVEGGPPPTYELTAIIIRSGYQAAIINGQILFVGNHLGEYTITSIKPNAVELQGSENNREVLQLVSPVRQELQRNGQ